MKPTTLASLAFAIILGGATLSESQTIRFGSVADFVPYNYLDNDGELQGFEAELSTLICARAGLTCEWALAPWNDMITELLNTSLTSS